MAESDELFSLEELEGSEDMQPEFDKVQIKNPYDQLFEEFNSLIKQLTNGTPKTDAEIMQLVVQANIILTELDRVTKQLITDGVITKEELTKIVMQIIEKRTILVNLTKKGGKKRKSKKSKKRKSKKRRRKSMKR